MRILVSGASGFIGKAVTHHLGKAGNDMVALRRGSGHPSWDPGRGEIDLGSARFDGVIHLAGENIAQRWNAAARRRIYDSRVHGTRLLCQKLARLSERPSVLICASGTAIYGDRGDELLDERSTEGAGFLTDVVRDWEAATAPASEAGIRVVNVRFGLVLASHGGALAKMLLPFKLGLGGKLGPGRQVWSWITLEDTARAISHCLVQSNIIGPVNVVSPQPVTNAEFTKALGGALHRPTLLPVPSFALRLVFGDMANETMLISFRVVPRALQSSGFRFHHPELDAALTHILGH